MKRISNTQQKIANRSMNQSIYSLKYSDHLFTIFSSLELMEILKSLLSIKRTHVWLKQENFVLQKVFLWYIETFGSNLLRTTWCLAQWGQIILKSYQNILDLCFNNFTIKISNFEENQQDNFFFPKNKKTKISSGVNDYKANVTS